MFAHHKTNSKENCLEYQELHLIVFGSVPVCFVPWYLSDTSVTETRSVMFRDKARWEFEDLDCHNFLFGVQGTNIRLKLQVST